MIKLINIITQNIILLGCCAISIFILFVLITFIKNVDDFAGLYEDKPSEIMKKHLNTLERNNKIFKFKPY